MIFSPSKYDWSNFYKNVTWGPVHALPSIPLHTWVVNLYAQFCIFLFFLENVLNSFNLNKRKLNFKWPFKKFWNKNKCVLLSLSILLNKLSQWKLYFWYDDLQFFNFLFTFFVVYFWQIDWQLLKGSVLSCALCCSFVD